MMKNCNTENFLAHPNIYLYTQGVPERCEQKSTYTEIQRKVKYINIYFFELLLYIERIEQIS